MSDSMTLRLFAFPLYSTRAVELRAEIERESQRDLARARMAAEVATGIVHEAYVVSDTVEGGNYVTTYGIRPKVASGVGLTGAESAADE